MRTRGNPVVKKIIQLNARYLSNLSTTFISQGVSALSIFILTPILVDQLGTTQFSNYGVILNLILFSAVFDLGLNIGLLRKLIHNNPNNLALVNTIFFFFSATSVLLVPMLWLFFKLGFVKVMDHTGLLSLFIAIIIIQNFLALFFDNIIQSANKIYVGKIIRICRTVIEFFVLWMVAKTGSFTNLLMATACINVLYLLALFLFAQKQFPFYLTLTKVDWRLLVEHIQYSFWYFQNSLASAMVFNVQVILISSFAEAVHVTQYLLITRFYDVLKAGLNNFIIVLFPSLSAYQAKQDWNAINSLYKKLLFRFVLLSCLVVLIMFTIGQYLFVWWSGYNDSSTLLAFQLYALLLAILLIENVPNVFLSALKNNKWPSVVATIQGLLGLGLTYLLLPHFGIVGAILSLISAFLLTNGWFNFVYMKQILKQQVKQ